MTELKYFKESEFNMNGEPCFDKMNKEFLRLLDELRVFVKRPITITSSYRSKEYNKSIGGAKTSQHLQGKAVDIYTRNWTGVDKRRLIEFCIEYDLSFGIAKNFIHVDMRSNTPTFWDYY